MTKSIKPLLLFAFLLLPLMMTKVAEAAQPQSWNIVKDCEELRGEHQNPQAFKRIVEKGTSLSVCFIISGQSDGAFLQLRRLAITDNDRMFISGINKPWIGDNPEPQHYFSQVNTASNYTAMYIDLNEELGVSASDELAIIVSSNIADHDREFIIMYDADIDGAFLGSLFLSTTDKTRQGGVRP